MTQTLLMTGGGALICALTAYPDDAIAWVLCGINLGLFIARVLIWFDKQTA